MGENMSHCNWRPAQPSCYYKLDSKWIVHGTYTTYSVDLLRPSCDRLVDGRQAQQKTDYARRARSRELHMGQQVMAWNLRQGVPWVSGVIDERLGPLRSCGSVIWITCMYEVMNRCLKETLNSRAQNGICEQPPTSSETSGRSDKSATSTLTQPVHCRYPQRERQPLNRYTWTFF